MNYTLLKSARLIFRPMLLTAVLLAAFFVVKPVVAAPVAPENSTQTLLVHFDADTPTATRDALIAEMGGELVTWIHQLNVAEIRLPVAAEAMIAAQPVALGAAMAQGMVTHVEADMAVSATYAPNDPDFSDATMSYGLEQVQALDAWDIVTGSQQIVIAVVDSGINAAHPEFAGRLVPGYNFIDEDNPDDLNDESGHGTHVAGILAAALDNGQGVAGVCPNCRLMPIKVLNENNIGSWSQLAQGIIFAVDNGAHILNLSLGTPVSSDTLTYAIEYAIERGVVVIASAGNNASDAPFFPAALRGVIGVGATTQEGERWAKSNFGDFIDLVAPGQVIYSTFNDLDNAYYGYTYMNGTSMATPFVSGIAGLLLSIAPELDADEVLAALILGAEDLGPTGRDADFGFGRVNAMGALKAPVGGLVDAVGEIADPYQQVVMFLPVLTNQ